MIGRLRQKQVGAKWYALALAGAVLLRLCIAFCQRVYLAPQTSSIDDMLMIRAAMQISEGNWLGGYGGVAIAKNMGFAVWLAGLHALGIPVLLANCALWLAACGFAVRALRPLLPGNVGRLCVFLLLAFQPVSFAGFTQRVYRDAIFPAFCLLLFAGALGLGLRLSQKRLRGSVFCAAGAGLGLAGGWLLREDGALLLVFAVCALLLVAGFAVWHGATARRLAKALISAVPMAVLGAGILAFSLANYLHYGVFAVNDFTHGNFPAAYGAMVGVSEAVSGEAGTTPVTREALEKMYAEVPALAGLEEYLTGGAAYNGFAKTDGSGEFGGSFYYALRLAAEYAGETPDAQTAQAYWATVAQQINAAVEEGRLQSAGASTSLIPRFRLGLVVATARETVAGGLHLLTFSDCDPRPQESVGTESSIAQVAEYLHSEVQSGYAEGTEEPYYNPFQRIVFALCDLLGAVYALAIWPLLALAVWRMLRVLGAGVKTIRSGITQELLWAVLILGLFCSAALRLVVAAYMEVASFEIGTYLMYLASAMPALLVAGVGGILLPVAERKKRVRILQGAHGRRDMRLFWVVAFGIALVAVKLVLAGAQSVYLSINEAPLDDGLVIEQAMSISAGNWLGEYGWKPLSKHSFFSLWLAGLHALGVSFLTAGQLLWAAASGAAAWAFRPALKRRWVALALFGALLFNPASTANPYPFAYITRVYRDNIFPALCLLVIAGMVGFALRWREPLKKSLGWLAAAGIALAACYLTREDGWWILPFVIAAAGITLVFILRGREKGRLQRCVALLLPFALLAGGVLAWSGVNSRYYGRFIVSDFSSGEFADAYGAMTRIEHESWDPKVAVPKDVREKLYRTVPAFAELEQYLESDFYLDRYAQEDYSSGSFYWALREAAAEAGHYDSPEKAQAYFTGLAEEINRLCDEGVLPAGAKRSSVNPPIKAEYVLPVVGEGLHSLWYVATFQDTDPRSMLSLDDPENNGPVEAYLNTEALVAAVAGTDEPYFNQWQQLSFRILDVVRTLYAWVTPVLFLLALVAQGFGLARLVQRLKSRKKRPAETLLCIVGLGILGMILLRVFMIGYVTVSSFMIGTYIMYLATVHPMMILYAAVGSAAFCWLALRATQIRRRAWRG